MGESKVTKMLIKVDLQCSKCYRKIKKLLCSFPQIRDQVFDEKANTVLITVVCCSPERIKHKLASKGKDTVIGIEIVQDKPKQPEKPKEPEKKETEKPKEPEKPKETEKKKEPETPKPKQPEKPKEAEKPKQPEKPKVTFAEPPKETPKSKPATEPPKDVSKPPAQAPVIKEHQYFPASGYPPQVYTVGQCCCQPYYGPGGAPCYCQGYGMPVAPPPMYFDGYGRGAYEYGGVHRGYHVGRCDDYFTEENGSGCSII